MSDLDRLVESFSNGSLLRPSQGALSIVDLPCAVALLVGVDDVERTPHTDDVADMIGSAEHLVFVVADGLGKSLVERLPSDSFIARHGRADLTTVFPSSTATALTTLATGKCAEPSCGYRLVDPRDGDRRRGSDPAIRTQVGRTGVVRAWG